METIIVEIAISSTAIVSDFMLPAHVPVRSLVEELIKLVEQVYQEITFEGETALLCSLTDQCVLPGNLTLAQCGVRDSHRLLLV